MKYRKQSKELEARLSKLEELEKLLDSDPLAALEKKGHSYDKLTKRILESKQLTPEEQKLADMTAQLEALRKEREEEKSAAQKRAEEEGRTAVLSSIQGALDAREDLAYSAIVGGSQTIYDQLVSFATEHGEEPSPDVQEEIASAVEKSAREAVHKQVEALLTKSPQFREYVKSLLAGSDRSTEPDQPAESGHKSRNSASRAEPKTLTKAQQSAVESRAPKRAGLDERMERALKRLGG